MQTFFYPFGTVGHLKITVPVTDALCQLWFDDCYTPWFDGNSDGNVPAIATDTHEPDGISIKCENKVVTVECKHSGHYNGVIAYFMARSEEGQLEELPFDMAQADSITFERANGNSFQAAKVASSQTGGNVRFQGAYRSGETGETVYIVSVISGNMNYLADKVPATMAADSQIVTTPRIAKLYKAKF